MNGGKFITTKEAKKALGVSEDTLRRWADDGVFPSIRTPGNQRLYNIEQYIQSSQRFEQSSNIQEKQKICYCRVSSISQKDDLQRQIKHLQEKFPDHKIVSDIGSGINFKRKGFRTILELASKGLVSEVVVAYRDRMCRFAFELVEWILHLNGVELLVLNENLDSTGQSELAEDLLAIINVFNCRVNGKRKYKVQKEDKTSGKPMQENQTAATS